MPRPERYLACGSGPMYEAWQVEEQSERRIIFLRGGAVAGIDFGGR